jgi:hypothetical protein
MFSDDVRPLLKRIHAPTLSYIAATIRLLTSLMADT